MGCASTLKVTAPVKPLVLVHGGLATSDMFGPSIPPLNTVRQVIAVDLQGHGRTADADRPLDPAVMADDIADLARFVGHDRIDLMGFSLGGLVALQTAMRHPGLVGRLILISTPIRHSAVYRERLMTAQSATVLADALRGSPIHALYECVAPNPQDWPILLQKTLTLVRRAYDYTDGLRELRSPVLFAQAAGCEGQVLIRSTAIGSEQMIEVDEYERAA